MTDIASSGRRGTHSHVTTRGAIRRTSLSLGWLVFACGLALSPVADFLSVRAAHGLDAAGGDARFSLLVRGGMITGLLFVLLTSRRVKLSSCRTALSAMMAIMASALTLTFGNMSNAEFAQQAVFILKVFSFFVCFAALAGMSEDQLEKLEKIVWLTLLFYALSIIVGAAFSVDMFRSYQADTQIRSGYKGIVYAQNEASSLMIVGLSYGLMTVLKSGWSLRSGALVICILLASPLIGTKAAIAGAIAVTCSYFYCRHRVPQATIRAFAVVGVLAGVALVAYCSVPRVKDAVDLSLQYFAYHHDHAGSGSMLTVALSGRDVKFFDVWGDVGRESYSPLLIGGYPVVRYLVEIDVLDLVFAMGLPVCVFYLWSLGRAFLYRGGGPVPRFSMWVYIALMATAFTAGHVLVSAVVSPYLAMIAVLAKRAAAERRSLQMKAGDE